MSPQFSSGSIARLNKARSASARLVARPGGDLGVGRKPHIALGLGVTDQLLQDPDARAIAANVGMHRQLEDAAILPGRVELAAEDVEHVGRRRIRAQRRKPVHHEIDRIVAHPFDRQLDDTAWFAVEQQLVAILVRHQRGIVEESHFGGDCQRGAALYHSG